MEILLTLSILFTLFVSFHGVYNVEGQAPPFQAMYQFGDSISDVGNDVQWDPNNGCGKPPYGQTFFDQKPTGRCSNGLLMVDYFAQAFKLPFLSPYLMKGGDFTHGANFAVAGATALTTSGTSLFKQLDWFNSHLATICANPIDCKQKLGNALFLMGEIGGNDYNTGGFGGSQTAEDLRSLVPRVVEAISAAVKQVINLGATKLVVSGNFPIGCMTIYLSNHKSGDRNMYDEFGCLKSWNGLAQNHNDQLQAAIKTLQGQYPNVKMPQPVKYHTPNVKIVYGDYFSAMYTILQQASSLGFEADGIHKACCGGGDNEYNFGGPFCGSPGATVCPNPDVRLSWDGIHLTQHAYQVMADRLVTQFLPALV